MLKKCNRNWRCNVGAAVLNVTHNDVLGSQV